MSESLQPERGLFTGVSNIVRFNPGFYIVGIVAVAVGIGLLAAFGSRLPGWMATTAWTGIGLSAWWILASLAASWWVYDLSPLYRWDWLERRLVPDCSAIHPAHAGFDEVTTSLRRRFPGIEVVPLDFHDPIRMTESSIQRARRLCPPLPDTLTVGLGPWSLPTSTKFILFALSAHEWRTPEERRQLFRRASESLEFGGKILLLEHLRDWRNAIIFGPGFLHFHSPATWRRDWEAAGLECRDRFHLAGFLGGFLLAPKNADPSQP